MRISLPFLLMCSWLFPLAAQAGAIHDAAKKGDVAAITAALDAGADVNESDGLATALYLAASRGNLDAARVLIKRGADVNLPAKFGTPLYTAAKFGYAEIVELLLVNGAKPNQATNSVVALHVAAANGCLACVTKLVEAGADVNAITSERVPPIHLARQNGHEDIAHYLRDHGAAKPAVAPISARLAKANPMSGEELFVRSCQKCHHNFASEEKNTIAPNLKGVVGRKKASTEHSGYSPALKEESGTWTYEELNVFISDPVRVIPGTIMAFEGVQDDAQRADIIAYLRTLSDAPLPLPAQ